MSTIAALLLFFSATVPALQENRHLRRVEVERQQEHTRLWWELDGESAKQMALRIDVQNLMVELDRQGIYPGDVFEPATGDPAKQPPIPSGGGTGSRDPR
jgi:hypothetical protein